MELIIIILPFTNFLVLSLGGRYLGFNGLQITTFFTFFLAILTSIFTLLQYQTQVYFKSITLTNWISLRPLEIDWCFMFDGLSYIMIFIVLIVSGSVHLFSLSYMRQDPHLVRFMSYLSIFTFFMLVLVSAGNLVVFFIGWEGVGLCSYLLINFWFTRIQANKAAMKAVLMNRIGDCSFLAGVILVQSTYKTVNFLDLQLLAQYLSDHQLTCGFLSINTHYLICMFFSIAAIAKSAQIVLHTWLADAMEGPTPVSALIHAATMVTAGIFLIMRLSTLFDYADSLNTLLVVWGSLTCLFSATIGITQTDLKKIIAFSTCSQLGYMVAGCGLSNYSAAFYHLANHAFFKAVLFLSAGAIIHILQGEQDLRKMGALSKIIPLTLSVNAIASLSLTALPTLSGAFSKDFILESAFVAYKIESSFFWTCGLLAAIFTFLYSNKLIIWVFFGQPNGYKSFYKAVEEPLDFRVIIPLLTLTYFSITSGYMWKEFFILGASDFFGKTLCPSNETSLLINAEFLPYYLKSVPLIITAGLYCILTGFLNSNVYKYQISTHLSFPYVIAFLTNKWFFDLLINRICKQVLIFSYNYLYLIIDKGFLELMGPLGIYKNSYKTSVIIYNFFAQNNQIKQIITTLFLSTLTLTLFL